MADRKITELTELSAGSQATGDLLTVVDVSETATESKNKKITVDSLFKGIPGDVGVGTASPATKLDVNGDVTITEKIIHSGDTNTYISFAADDTFAVTTAGTERIRVLAAGGLTFGGETDDEHALDDYEEGTFSKKTAQNPNGWDLVSGNDDHSLTTDSNTGYYVKIGRLVYFTLRITNIDVTTAGTGGGRLTGLPFPSEDTSAHLHGAVNVTLSDLFGTIIDTSAYITSNSTTVRFLQRGTSTTQNFSSGSNKVLLVSGFYRSAT